jgi:hypothetical protein
LLDTCTESTNFVARVGPTVIEAIIIPALIRILGAFATAERQNQTDYHEKSNELRHEPSPHFANGQPGSM